MLLARLIRWWMFRDRSREQLEEEYSVLLKSARRCAHDLDHALNWIPRDHWANSMFQDRAQHWLKIFSPDGMKDYRIDLHYEIEELERDVRRLKNILDSNGIRYEDDVF